MQDNNSPEAKLTIEIKNRQPVELGDLTLSLLGVADEYKKFALREGIGPADDVRLYVQEIRSGSIITKLVPHLPEAAVGGLLLMHEVNKDIGGIIQFGKYLQSSFNYLLGKTEGKPNLDKQSYSNLSKIVEPVAKDNGSQMNVTAENINFNAPVTFHLGTTESNAIQNVIQREIEALREPATGNKSQVVLYWYQARNDTKSDKGDRAIIESISSSPVKVVFADDSIKANLLLNDDNLFKFAYVVDVAVETVKGRPVVYRILKVHDKFENPQEPLSEQITLL